MRHSPFQLLTRSFIQSGSNVFEFGSMSKWFIEGGMVNLQTIPNQSGMTIMLTSLIIVSVDLWSALIKFEYTVQIAHPLVMIVVTQLQQWTNKLH